MNRFGSLIILLFLFPQFTLASVQITEIMYDLPGADSKREWVKIYNSGSSAVDLADWRFHDGSNHTLNVPPENGGQGSILLSPNSAAYLVSNAETFLTENRTSLSVIDTVMSLNNTTDTLTLYDQDGTLVHQVTYTSDQGGAGDGSFISLSGPTTPLPETVIEEVVEEIVFDPYVNPEMRANAGPNLSGVAGERLILNGEAFGSKGEALKNARYVRNIGNQEILEGKSVSHTFYYPGTHSIVLTVANGRFSVSDHASVSISKPNLSFTSNEFGLAVTNNENVLLTISGWMIRNATSATVFPDESYLFPNRELFIESKIHPNSVVELLLPNGVAIATTSWQKVIEPEPVIVPVVVEKPKSIEKRVSVVEEVVEESAASTATSVASVFVSPVVQEESSPYPWLLGLLVLITLGGFAGVIVLGEREEKSLVDEFKIESSEKMS